MRKWGKVQSFEGELIHPLQALLFAIQKSYTLIDGEGDLLNVKVQDLDLLIGADMRFGEQRLKALLQIFKEKSNDSK